MSPTLYAAFVGATVILMLIPGPNVALIVANSLAHGARGGLMTVAGTSAAMVVQLAVASFGLSALFGVLAQSFDALRWIGVAYLLGVAALAWAAPAIDLTAVRPASARTTTLRGFFVSLTNPKTLAFYAAFLPQFLDPERDMMRQMLILSGTFLALAVTLDSGWALLAARLSGLLTTSGRLRNRLTALALIGASLGLALARRS